MRIVGHAADGLFIFCIEFSLNFFLERMGNFLGNRV